MLAKCQSCNQKTLLCVCSHCDNVVCGKCRDEHLKNADVELRTQWDSCRNRYESIKDESCKKFLFKFLSFSHLIHVQYDIIVNNRQ